MPDQGLAAIRWKDIGITALYAVVVALALRVFIVSAYEIPSHSMENTLLPGDYIVVSKITFLLRDVRRGDVITFHHRDSASSIGETYIKRVIGLPGDTVILTINGVIVNGIPFPTPPEARVPSSPLLSSMKAPHRIIVGADSLYVLGDNRRNSYDSRYWGSVALSDVKGSPLFTYWSYGPSDDNPLPHIRWERMFRGIH